MLLRRLALLSLLLALAAPALAAADFIDRLEEAHALIADRRYREARDLLNGPLFKLARQPAQKALLLVASYFFYGAWDYRFLGLIFLSTAVDYVAGKRIESSDSSAQRRGWLAFSLVAWLRWGWSCFYSHGLWKSIQWRRKARPEKDRQPKKGIEATAPPSSGT